MNYLSSYCTIRNLSIRKNEELLHKNDHSSWTDFLTESYVKLAINYPKFYKMDNLSKSGFLATEVLLSSISIDEYAVYERTIVLSNRSSSLQSDINYLESTKQIASPALFVYTLPNIVIGEISIRNKIKGESAFFVSDDFDATFITSYIDNILAGNAKMCIGGWVETIGEQHDVFLYLVEKINRGKSLEHTEMNVTGIFNKTYGAA